jgi:XTP/dITP diphosphohydrolase
MIIYACTGNPGKLREFALAARNAGTAGIFIEPLPGLKDIPSPEETGKSFEENAVLKAIYYSGFTSELVFADDSGIEVDALNGAPGVYSARFAGADATDTDNNQLLLTRLGSAENRNGRFVCVIAVAHQGKLVRTFRRTVEGEILRELRGAGGFGYDPLFFYPPLQKTLAELPPEEKFSVSHRGKALRAMIEWLAKATVIKVDSGETAET